MLSVIIQNDDSECSAEFGFADCHYAQCCYTDSHFSNRRYYNSVIILNVFMVSVIVPTRMFFDIFPALPAKNILVGTATLTRKTLNILMFLE